MREQILGKGASEMLDAGDIELKDLVQKTDHEIWGPSLQRTPLRDLGEGAIDITPTRLPDIPKFKTVDEGMYWIEDNVITKVNSTSGTRVTRQTVQSLAQELQEIEYRTGASPRNILFDSSKFKGKKTLAFYDPNDRTLYLRGNYAERITMLAEAPAGWFASPTLKGNVWHEMGHVIDDQSDRAYAQALKRVADSKDIRKISVYALSDWGDTGGWDGAEGFAEAVSAYATGQQDKLSPEILDIMGRVFRR